MNKSLFTTPLGWLRTIGFLEGLSFLVLLGIAMPLKYYFDQPEAVKHVGMAHGILFIFYVALVGYNALKDKWPIAQTIWCLLASLLPFGTFYVDAKFFKK